MPDLPVPEIKSAEYFTIRPSVEYMADLYWKREVLEWRVQAGLRELGRRLQLAYDRRIMKELNK